MMNTRNGNKKVTTSTNALAPDDIPVFGEMRDAGPAAAPRAAAGAAAASRAAAGAGAASRAAAGAAAAPDANVDAQAPSIDEIIKSLQARAEEDMVGEKRKRDENEQQLERERIQHEELMQKANEQLKKNESVLSQSEKITETLKLKAEASRAVLNSLKSKAPRYSQADIDQARKIMEIVKSLEESKKSDDDNPKEDEAGRNAVLNGEPKKDEAGRNAVLNGEPKKDEAGPNAVLNGGLLMAGNAFVGAGDLLRQASESATLGNVLIGAAAVFAASRLFR